MRPIRLAIALLLMVCGLGCSEELEPLIRRSGSAVIREIPAREARREADAGTARLVQPWPLEAGEVRVPGADPVAAGEEPGWPGNLLIVVGSGPAAWALAARIQRSGARRVAIAPASAEEWPVPRATLRERNPVDASLTDERGW